MEKNPCCMRTWPWPPQVAQLTGLVPGVAPLPEQSAHCTLVGTRILAVVPNTASSRLMPRS